ncbi:MAG TPA: hypothetical protein VF800_02640 [Telluria sp.]|jgi:hypothetical protein
MRFYEQVFDGRTIICADLVARADVQGDRVIRDIDADCWIDAKRKLGYMLSAVQEWLLDEFYAKRARSGRVDLNA